MTHPGAARIEGLRIALVSAGLDALLCARPSNVLLCSGYWPVVGTSCAIVTRAGRIAVIAPGDELALARRGWADEVVSFAPAALDDLRTAAEALRDPLRALLRRLGIVDGRIGVEWDATMEPSSYVGTNRYGASLTALLRDAGLDPVPADALLAGLRAVKTPHEIARIAAACDVARIAFEQGASVMRGGLTEAEAASFFRAPLATAADDADAARADGYAACMSGANAATAYGAYARSTFKRLDDGELVLIHCNSFVDGYWTDITRTYCLGEPDAHRRAMYEAVFAARDAALDAICVGARAADVDAAARGELRTRGFGDAFKHPTGHGVGFAAIDHGARPMLHPRSTHVLERGMVFNVEPGIYLDGEAGLRHCDVIALEDDGPRVLTPFHDDLEALTVVHSHAGGRA